MGWDGGQLKELLLLSGGVDSTCVAAWRQPAGALAIDYGQRPAYGELMAAGAVAAALSIEFATLRVDCSRIGSGLMAGGPISDVAPSSEWWPYRNQLLVTMAAAWALPRGYQALILGSVQSDGFHADGRPEFYKTVDQLVASQEGGLRVWAPAIEMSSADLLVQSGVPGSVLGWTMSCHRAPVACGDCPGCDKRRAVLTETGRLG